MQESISPQTMAQWLAIAVLIFGGGAAWGRTLMKDRHQDKDIGELKAKINDGVYVRKDVCEEKHESIQRALSHIRKDLRLIKRHLLGDKFVDDSEDS